MTDLTRLYAVKTVDAAADKAGFWKGRGYHVAVVGPTDAIQLRKADDEESTWESGSSADWYVVLASKAPLDVITAKAE